MSINQRITQVIEYSHEKARRCARLLVIPLGFAYIF